MDRIELSQDGAPLIAPKEGYVLMVRFKLQQRHEFDTLFCDYGLVSGPDIQFYGCRCKTFVVGNMPCDYAVKVGTMHVRFDCVMDVFQLPTPPWYHRREEDALDLTFEERLSLDVGVLDVLSELTSTR